MAPLWTALAEVAPAAAGRAGAARVARASSLHAILEEAGLPDVEVSELAVTVTHPTFEEWWEPYLHGVGPVGEAIAALDPAAGARLEQPCAAASARAVRDHRGRVRGPRRA